MLKELKGPQLLHVITKKGKGYERAEGDQIEYHAVGPFDPKVGVVKKPGAGQTHLHPGVRRLVVRHGQAADAKLAGITPAMREGSGLVRFSQGIPAAAIATSRSPNSMR
jgi:1-deoxy-D-xylulose-5-phosphate synthase